MPSLRHRAAVAYIRLRRHHPPTRDVAEAEQRVLAGRTDERPGPPRRVLRRCEIRTDHAAGFPVHTVTPRAKAADGPRVIYLHGGSYTADLQPKHWTFVASLVERTRATVVLPQYPVAPEATWRTSWDALVELARGGVPPVLAGDSAGGGLALALAVELVRRGAQVPGIVLDAPWVDLTVSQDDDALAATDDPWLEPETLRHSGLLWAGGDDPRRPELSPLFADLEGLPRTLLLVGTRDVLHPQNVELVERLRQAGADVETVVEDGLLHVFPLLPVPEGRRAVARICDFLDATARVG